MSLQAMKTDAKESAKDIAKVEVQAVLCWSEYYNGKWQPLKPLTSIAGIPRHVPRSRPPHVQPVKSGGCFHTKSKTPALYASASPVKRDGFLSLQHTQSTLARERRIAAIRYCASGIWTRHKPDRANAHLFLH